MTTHTWLNGLTGDWNTAADWSGGVPTALDTAVISAPGAYLVTLFGTGAIANLTIAASGAEFYDAGSLALSGTLALQSGTLALAYGTIAGGTLAIGGGSFASTGGTLDGVSVQGRLDLGAANATLFVRDGLTLSGAGGSGMGSIALTGGYAALDCIGNETLGNAVISLGAAGGAGPATLAINHAGGATSGATLTLGASAWLRQSGGAGVTGMVAVGSIGPLPGLGLPDEFINAGTITAATSGATLDIAGAGSFLNQGTIAVSNGATLEIATAGFANAGSILVSNATLALGGTFSAGLLSALGSLSLNAGTPAAGQLQILGTADNTGGTLSLGAGSHLGALLGPVSLAGTILNGTVLDAGNGLGFSTGTGVLDGVTYAGTLNLAPANSGLTG